MCLVPGELERESYQIIQARVQEEKRRKANSLKVIQRGAMITVESARERKKEKEEKERADAINKVRKNIQVVVNKAKTTLNCHGINTDKAETQRNTQIQRFLAAGGIVPTELLILISDPEKNPSAQDLESLEPPPDLLLALLLLELISHSTSNVIDSQLLALSGEVENGLGGQRGVKTSHSGDNSEDSGNESDSGSSSTSNDLITSIANFVAFN